MKKILSLLCSGIIILSITACKKKTAALILDNAEAAETAETITVSDSAIDLPGKTIKKPEYSISRNYLKDRIDFKSLIQEQFKTAKTAVVGTEGVKLYKNISGKNEICSIPKGALLPLTREIMHQKDKNSDDFDCTETFEFEKERNFWYETEYNDNKGYVFGSYLVFGGDGEDWDSTFSTVAIQNNEFTVKYTDTEKEKLKKLSYYYTKSEKAESFYNFNGRANLDPAIQQSLINSRIAIEKINFNEYSGHLHSELPDDMIALYAMLHNDKMATTFITTDLFVHSLHLLFDRMLQSAEENRLLPILKNLTALYYKNLENLEKENKNSQELSNSISLMKKYFLVAGDLLNIKLIEKSAYPEDVLLELEKINSASGSSESPVFKYKEDYTQFIPRGHYTKNDNLKKYFKAMMWFGRLHFYCSYNRNDTQRNEISISHTRASLLLTKIAMENNGILILWHALYNPITYIVGESDDYNLDQYLSISDSVDFKDFGKWISDKKNIINFIEKANKQFKNPAISGNTLLQNGIFNTEAPQGFRFFGQRFTLDGFIFSMLSSPRVGNNSSARTMVKGLDLMAVLGNKKADALLQEDRKKYINFESNYNTLKKSVNGFSDDYWRGTFYRSYLKIIKEISAFDSGTPFYFTQSELWNSKSLVTAHAAWAELKHDTLLYAKQSAAEKAGPGPCKTWHVDPLQRPLGYIEPDLGVLYWIQSILEDSMTILVKNEVMSDYFKSRFEDYYKLICHAVDIAECEAADKKISDEQNEFIYQISSKLANIVRPPDGNIIDQNQLKMALIADVHTDSEKGMALEIGTGIPYRIYVALNDGNGGKRIATGYMFSYYEFEHPSSDRLTDEKWKEIIYNSAGTDKYKPNWSKELLCR